MPEQKVKRIRAFNSLGQLCADEQNASLNMNGLAPGIYLLMVETTSGTFSVKATKE
jgi:hypothetical protein